MKFRDFLLKEDFDTCLILFEKGDLKMNHEMDFLVSLCFSKEKSDNKFQHIFHKCLLNSKVSLHRRNNILVRKIANNGWLESMEYILTKNEVNTSVGNGEPLFLAAENGHLDMVQLILNNRFIDTHPNKNFSILQSMEIAFNNKHHEICSVMVNLPEINELLLEIPHIKKNIDNIKKTVSKYTLKNNIVGF